MEAYGWNSAFCPYLNAHHLLQCSLPCVSLPITVTALKFVSVPDPQTIPEKEKDLGEQGLNENKLRAAWQSCVMTLSSFVLLPPPHPGLCWRSGFGHKRQTHSHTALKRKRTSLTTSGMHPQCINFAANGVNSQLIQNLAVNCTWRFTQMVSVSTRYTLTHKCSLILSVPLWP